MPRFRHLALFATMSFSAFPAFAQDKPAAEQKAVSGEAKFELHNNWATRSDDAANKRNDTWLKIEAVTDARLAPGLTLKTQVTVEPVSNAEPGKDRFFGDQGAYLQNVFLEYADGAFALRGGKFGQKFGTAWEAAPGIWGRDFAKNYELAEQVGFAADYDFGSPAAGKHVVTAGSFFTDTSVLSESVVTNRHRKHQADGGAGNTGDFSNFSLAVAGSDIPALPGLRYHLGHTSRGGDGAGEVREKGYVGGIQFTVKLGAVEATPLVEYARFTDREGASGTDTDYLTTALRFDYGKWNLALARTGRKTKSAGSSGVDDHSSQASVGYAFDGGVVLSGGGRKVEETGVDTDTLGLLVEYVVKY